MMRNLKPYESYRKINLNWLDKIPSHWNVVNNIEIWAERNKKNCADEELLSVTINKGVIRQKDLLSSTSKKDSSNTDKSNYKYVERNDIVYNKMRMWQGAVGVSNFRGIVSPAYIVLKPRIEINPKYYHYLLRTPYYVGESYRFSYGICDDQLSLRYEDFKRMKNIMPPKYEQDQIVKYLDYKLAKINKFIKTKKRLISVLKEQKQAVINQAVTKGLNPNVKMKPSGIEWIGDIPEHWEITRNKNLLKLRKETVGNEYNKHILLSLTTNGIIPRDMENAKGKFPTDFTTYQKVYINDLVFCLFDIDETPRTVGLSSLEGMITGAYTVFSVVNSNKDYLYYYYLSLDQKKALKPLYTGLRKVIPTDVFLRAKVPQPPIEEQLEIVEFIHENISTIDKTIAIAQQEIELITEYRTRLISDVVTGKVDVRGIVVDDVLEEDMELDVIEEELEEHEEAFDAEECEV
ncbi:MAG: restriction endonuclease subunit S [Paenisporosarcina sp.]